MATITNIQTVPVGFKAGRNWYAVTANLNGKPCTLRQFDLLQSAIEFAGHVHGYVAGNYYADVFDAINAELQSRAES